MILRRMTGSFGSLQNQTLEVGPGLNILEGPNEYGKSTWCAFLRTMLYGLETRRPAGGQLSDRQRYAPWDGTPMSGSIDLTWQGRDITLRRTTDTPNAPMRRFSAVYAGTEIPVKELTETDAGETLTGFSLPVFRRTAYIPSGEMAVGHGPELEKHIAAMVASGGEESSYTEASSRLKGWQRQCRYRGQGRLPELERSMETLRQRMEEIRQTEAQLQRAETAQEEARKRLSAARAAAETGAKRLQSEQLNTRLELERQAMAIRQQADIFRNALRAGLLGGNAPDEDRRAAMEEDHRRASALWDAGQTRVLPAWPVILCCAVAVIFALAGPFRPWAFVGAAIGLLAAGAFYYLHRKAKSRARKTERELRRLLKAYGAADPEEIPRQYARYEQQWNEVRELSDRAEQLQAEAREAGNASAAGAERSRELSELSRALEQCAGEAALCRGKLETMGDIRELEELLSAQQAEYVRLCRREQALTLALEALQGADEEMQARVSPRLAKTTEGIFRRITGAEDAVLALDRTLAASVRQGGETVPHGEGWLSRGTRDQLYFSLRLALCQLLDPEGACPIVLDDALINFDQERMERALDYLLELGENRQILLFTCHRREREYLKI